MDLLGVLTCFDGVVADVDFLFRGVFGFGTWKDFECNCIVLNLIILFYILIDAKKINKMSTVRLSICR